MPTLPPSEPEWSFRDLPIARREFLEAAACFEALCDQIVEQGRVVSANVVPFESARTTVERKAKQIVVRVSVTNDICDAFYNSKDGLRGRYWQSPDVGYSATRHFIGSLRTLVLADPLVRSKSSEINLESSLDAVSAKVWVFEFDASGARNIKPAGQPSIFVKRWNDAENAPPGEFWKWCPNDRDLEIKGGLVHEGLEYIPEGKRDRSCKIHHFGFT